MLWIIWMRGLNQGSNLKYCFSKAEKSSMNFCSLKIFLMPYLWEELGFECYQKETNFVTIRQLAQK